MKVTGYQLREAIRRHELARDTAANLFKDSLHKFQGEDKANPMDAMNQFKEAGSAVVTLQTAQQRYNLAVSVEVQGKQVTLSEAVKSLGGAGRAEKMWRDAVSQKKDRYDYQNNLERSKDTERAVRVVPYETAMKQANASAGYAGAVRAAIATGNATEVEIENLDASVL